MLDRSTLFHSRFLGICGKVDRRISVNANVGDAPVPEGNKMIDGVIGASKIVDANARRIDRANSLDLYDRNACRCSQADIRFIGGHRKENRIYALAKKRF